MITYLLDEGTIDQKTRDSLSSCLLDTQINEMYVFPDVHYASEYSIPVGVSFSSDKIYPLITGKDIGCGIGYLQFSKEYLIKPFDKSKHYNALYQAHLSMTNEGLGGGNHFLSIEEDSNNIYIICHTGTRNRGIAMYQRLLKIQNEYKIESGLDVNYVEKDYLDDKLINDYKNLLVYSHMRRRDFCVETLKFLQRNKYVITGESHNMYELNGVPFEYTDSMHNFIHFVDSGKSIIHRKGASGLYDKYPVVIALSMTRGCLIVEKQYDYALNSCSHGAGRKLSRTEAMRYWKSGLKKKERDNYKKQLSEMLNREGEFDSRYIQEMDFAYKDSSEILKYQPHVRKITETKPIVTIKFNI